jgi:diaminopimelate epimerase
MRFAKLQAAGNDFVVIDARSLELDWSTLAKQLCDRHFGVGADGLILVFNSDVADFGMRVINSDGTETEMCGNGLRCFARYVIENKLINGTMIEVATLAGNRSVQAILTEGEVVSAKANMGKPRFKADEIPVNISQNANGDERVDIIPIIDYPVTIDGNIMKLSFVSVGNPHAVYFIDTKVADFPLSTIGPEVERNELFPNRINFGIAHVIDKKNIEARVWERGAGETLACGTGTCAIAIVARLKGYIEDKVDIMLPGGKLTVQWDGVGEIFLTGPVAMVFEGEWKTI